MSLFKKNRLFFLLLLILALVLFVQTALSFLFPSPKIKTVIPTGGSNNVPIDTTISVVFEKKLNKNTIAISLSPQTPTKEEIKNNLLEIKPIQKLKFNTVYVLVVKDRVKNKEILQTRFRTLAPQGGPETVKELEKDLQENYPLAPYSPPDNASFYFLYTGPRELKVFLRGDKEKTKEAFLSWVKSLGINTSKHQITYTTPP